MPRPPRTLLAQLTAERGWSVSKFCREFETAAATLDLGIHAISERAVKHWRAGRITRPQDPAGRVLEYMFELPVEELLRPLPRTADRQPYDLTRHAVPSPPAATYSEDARGLQTPEIAGCYPAASRRDAPPHDGALERQIHMSVRRARAFLPLAEETNVGAETMASLTAELRRLARAYPVEPMHSLFLDLSTLQDLVFRLLERRQRPDHTRDLYWLAGASSALLASGCMDLGNPGAAIDHSRTAYVCAENAGDTELQAYVRVIQSMTSYWAGWIEDASDYAAAGISLPAHGTVSVWLPALAARAHAAHGDIDAARRSLDQTAEAHAAATSTDLDAIGGQFTFTAPRRLYYTADVLTWSSDDAADAVQAARAAVAAYETAVPELASGQNLVLSRLAHALAHARDHDLEATEAALDPVLALSPAHRTDPVRNAARRVHRALTGPHPQSPSVRALTSDLEYFVRDTPPALPTS
jgi:hypothetical protein